MRVEVYTRAHCSLCFRAEVLLKKAQEQIRFDLHWIDIGGDPELSQRFRYDVPLVRIDGRDAFRHRFSLEDLIAALESGTSVAE